MHAYYILYHKFNVISTINREKGGDTDKMKKATIFSGCGTALVTPFKNGEIDYRALGDLIEKQIAGGAAALIVGGTTGEAATLTDSERYALFEFCREHTSGRVKLIFGTGTNDTAAAIRHSRIAERIGCDGLLTVTPYYNKGTEEGLYSHYRAIAEEVSLPILLYNVPGRTGVNLSRALLDRLALIQNIVGIKEAADSADRLVSLREYGDELSLYAGSDSQIYTVLALGGKGVISVLSNPYPAYVSKMCRAFFEGRQEESLSMQISAMEMIRALFVETNPAPVKYLCARFGLCENELRLPLAPIERTTREKIDTAIDRFNCS